MTLITNSKQLEDIIKIVIQNSKDNADWESGWLDSKLVFGEAKQEIIKYFNLPDLFTNESNSN